MIRNIVFDIGGVLADFRIQEFLAEKGFDGQTIRRILKASALNPAWGKFERGEISEEETVQAFVDADPGIEQELRLAFRSLEGMLVSRPYAIPLVRQLKEAGYGVYYLSNYSRKAYEECGESLSFMPDMDGGLVSFRAGLTKPDPAIYRLFLRSYSLKAGECVFVDDTEENVHAAEEVGFQGIVFSSPEQLTGALEALGIRNGKAL